MAAEAPALEIYDIVVFIVTDAVLYVEPGRGPVQAGGASLLGDQDKLGQVGLAQGRYVDGSA